MNVQLVMSANLENALAFLAVFPITNVAQLRFVRREDALKDAEVTAIVLLKWPVLTSCVKIHVRLKLAEQMLSVLQSTTKLSVDVLKVLLEIQFKAAKWNKKNAISTKTVAYQRSVFPIDVFLAVDQIATAPLR